MSPIVDPQSGSGALPRPKITKEELCKAYKAGDFPETEEGRALYRDIFQAERSRDWFKSHAGSANQEQSLRQLSNEDLYRLKQVVVMRIRYLKSQYHGATFDELTQTDLSTLNRALGSVLESRCGR